MTAIVPIRSATPAPTGSTPDFVDRWVARLLRLVAGKRAELTPAQAERLLDAALSRARPAIARLRDPFTALAAGDPAARARENVVWESPRVMAVAARFDRHPTKILVVPRQQRNFPTDLTDAERAEISRVVSAVSAAYQSVAGTGPAEVFISSPAEMELARMHVHVHPEGLSLPRTARPKFFQDMAATLQRRLG